MTARIYFNASATSNTYVEVDARMRLLDWEVREQAEEGSAAMSTIVFDDPDMDWDVTPWRGWYMVEDASEGSNSIICGGWVTEQEIGREGGDRENPLGRVWAVSLTDANAYWAMRVMVGSDANRPAETDVERMQWLLATNEVAWAYDTTTYVQTTSPVAMDACDYRGQMLNQIMDDCAQASGRNWYTWIDLVGGVRKVMVWYGHDDWAVRDSPLYLTNDPADIVESQITDGTSPVWLISPDTKLNRDPSRMYDGVYLQYTGGAVYRDTDPRTVIRDFISPSYNVKSQAKAIARANRYLSELDEQTVVITTSVEVPASKVTQLRAGMRVPFRATHLPDFDGDYTWCRILSCTTAPIDDGTRYRLTLELAPGAVVLPGQFAGLLQANYGSDFSPKKSFETTGDNPIAGWYPEPTVGDFSFAESSAPYYTIVVGADMTVRIEAAIYGAAVAGPARTMSVRVNGDIVGSDTYTPGGGGYWVHWFHVDIPTIDVLTGDEVTMDCYGGDGFGGFTVNMTYLRVGRGVHYWNDNTTSWTGPTG